VGKERVVLGDQAEPAVMNRHVVHHAAADDHLPGVGADQPRDDPERGGLATSARTEERHELTGLDAQVEGGDRLHCAIPLGDTPQLDVSHLRAARGRAH